MNRPLPQCVIIVALSYGASLSVHPPLALAQPVVERITTRAPFPRGLAMVDNKLYVLCRGRVRNAGGVSAEVEDQAGTIYVVDPEIAEPIDQDEVGQAVRSNGQILAAPTDPPFRLWDRTAVPPESDRETDRPYCTLRYHRPTHSFYICAFSGIDKPKRPGDPSFSKNLNDAILRYDLRTQRWHDVERHDLEAGGIYPHHNPALFAPPHGWLNGPDNCLAIGNSLYAVAKDNSVLVRYDLSAIADDPEAGAPPSELVVGTALQIRGHGRLELLGHSALAVNDAYLYIGYRTSSVIVRIPITEDGLVKQPIEGELVARFEPYDPITGRSANITDIAFDSKGRLYVVAAQPARIYRFKPNPSDVYDAADGAQPWLDLAEVTGNPTLKAENILIEEGAGGRNRIFITTGNGYDFQDGALGTVYRATIDD